MATKRRVTPMKVLGTIGFWLLIIVIFIYLIFPFYWAFISALKTQSELIRTPATYWPENPTLQNFRAVFQNPGSCEG
jgi:trehalose/maltose transport system permease protein